MRNLHTIARRLSRQLREFEFVHLEQSFETVCARYGVPKSSLCVLPRAWRVSKSIPEVDTIDIYASASESTPVYYARPFMKDVRYIPLEIRVAHVFVHEMVHYAAGSRVESQIIALKKKERTNKLIVHAQLSGFQVDVALEAAPLGDRMPAFMTEYHAFNEGVTELIAREVFAHWVRTIPLRGVEKEALEEYILALDVHGFYQESVSFIRSLLMRVSAGMGTNPHELLGWLVRAYVEGRVLDQDAQWHEWMQRGQLPTDFSARIAQASSCEELKALYQEYLAGKVRFTGGEIGEEWSVDSFELVLET